MVLPSRKDDSLSKARAREKAAKAANAKAWTNYRRTKTAANWMKWQDTIEWLARCEDRVLALVLDARNNRMR